MKMTNDGNYIEFDPLYLVFDFTYSLMRHETCTHRRTTITGKKDTTRAQRENGREKGLSAEQALLVKRICRWTNTSECIRFGFLLFRWKKE